MSSLARVNQKQWSGWWNRPQSPVITLITASLVVGLAIATRGTLSKTINGIGGILWLVAAIALGSRLKSAGQWTRHALYAFVLTLSLTLLVKPTDLAWAVIGFAVGGLLLGLEVKSRQLEWAGFLVAIWLPVHLLVAVVRLLERSLGNLPATVRTDPPPTAVLVPFAMVLCALIGSQVAVNVLAKKKEH